jgi:hypothetical protein
MSARQARLPMNIGVTLAEPLVESDPATDPPNREGEKKMSHHTIGIVMSRLLGDEDLRRRFAMDRVEAISELQAHGVELTPREIDLFVEADVQMWFWDDRRIADRTN